MPVMPIGFCRKRNASQSFHPSAFVLRVKTDNTGANNDNQFRLAGSGVCDVDIVDWGDGTQSLGITNWSNGAHPELLHTYPAPGEYDIVVVERSVGGLGLFRAGTSGPTIDDPQKIIDIKQWGETTRNATNWGSRFAYAYNLQDWSATDSENIVISGGGSLTSSFRDCRSLVDPDFANADFSGATGNAASTFFGCSSFNSDLSHLDWSGITTMAATFRGCTVFNKPPPRTPNCSSYGFAFGFCHAFDQDLSYIRTDVPVNFNSFLYQCREFNSPLPNNVIVSSAFANAFFQCHKFNRPEIATWDVSNATSLQSTFRDCLVFNQDISAWDVSNVATTAICFRGCNSFAQNLTPWAARLSNSCTNFNQTFYNIPTANWVSSGTDWSAFTGSPTDIRSMFGATQYWQTMSVEDWNVSDLLFATNFFHGSTNTATFIPKAQIHAILEKWSAQVLQPNVAVSLRGEYDIATHQGFVDTLTNAPNSWNLGNLTGV